MFCSGLYALKLRSPHHPKSKGPNQFFFHWILFCWVTQFLFCSFLIHSDLFALKWGVPNTQSPKVPTNFYSTEFCSAGSHNFCSAHFCSALTFLHLDWRGGGPHHPKSKGPNQFLFHSFLFCSDLFALKHEAPTSKVQRSPPIFVPLNFVPLGHTTFVLLIFVLLWPFLHLTWGGGSIPTTQSKKVPTNIYSAQISSALTFLHLNWRPTQSKVQRSPPIFIPLIFVLLGHTIFVPLIFVLLWTFCT